MGLIKNAINFGNGFNIGAVAPIDSRMRVEKVADLTTAWTSAMPAYKGMIVTVMDTSEVYVLKDADNYTSIDSWVKLGSASDADAGAADALTKAKAYTDQLANGAVKKNTNAIATLNGDANTDGSVAKAVAAEKTRAMAAEKANADAITAETAAREAAITALDATVGGTAVAEGKHVAVQVVEENGKLTSLTVTESDIASATGLTAEISAREEADQAINDKIGTVGTGTTIVAMISDEANRATKAESDLAKRVTANETSINTLKGNATTEGSVAYAVADEQRRAEGKESELATSIANESTARTTADTALSNRLTVIEGEGEGSIKKAIADIKGTLGETDAKTLAALNKRIDKVVTDAKTYSIAKATDEEVGKLGTNVKEAYKLIDEDSKLSGAYIPVYKDSSLKSVALDGQILKFTYILDNGSEDIVGVDVSTFLAESEFANGLQVVNHIVSVKVDATSEDFLTVGEGGVKLSGVQTAIDTAKKEVTDSLDIIKGEETVNGSIKKALKDAKDYADTQISSLDATVGSQTVASGKHVAVEVVEENGKLKTLTVNESDIASATGLTSEINRAKAAEEANATAIAKLNGNDKTTGSVAKAVADAKKELLGNAAEGYNTLGKLEDKVIAAESAAKAAATKIAAKTTGHVTVSSSQDNTTSALTYTISENDIASANDLTAETQTRASEDTAIKGRLDVLERVTVTGENAILVDESSATANKKVSLKLGTQPAAGVVLSQDANGLVAKLYWGTF